MPGTEPRDYKSRTYLSAVEAARYLGTTVRALHRLVRRGALPATVSASGQLRFDIGALKAYECAHGAAAGPTAEIPRVNTVESNGTVQRLYVGDASRMEELPDGSVHLMVTSPPYFDTKMYSREPLPGDLGNVHDVDEWFRRIGEVWREVFRVLQPGRKAFINIMNLPVRLEGGGFRTLNLVGRTIDLCESIGFVFKRDIVWQKSNAVRAHFGTYPYPGGILINNMHEFILEFEKPAPKGFDKYGHLTREQKEASKIEKEFWLELKKSDVWVMRPEGSGDRRSHVAPFPYELPWRLIKAYSYVGETVLDPFAGSGTTLRAARDLGRNGVGYELDPIIAAGALRSLRSLQTRIDGGPIA
ncbi:MAG: DNA methyltransferase [Thermoplasmata archaeon]